MLKRKILKFFSGLNYKVLFFAILGSALVAFGSAIHDQSGAADGGILGVARLVAHYSGGKITFSTVIILLNAFFYLIAWRLMNAKFISTMAFGTIFFYIFTNLFSTYLVLDISNVLVATIVGTIFIEVGTGLMLRYGSAPTGEQVLSTSIAKRGELDFGWFSFIKDFIIIVMCFPIVDGINAIIYSVIAMTICTPIDEFIINAPKKSSIKKNIEKKKTKWVRIVVTGLVIVFVFAIASIYLNDYYEADDAKISNYTYETVEKAEFDGTYIAYVPKGEIKSGFVFYPGGKVEYTAYEPLLQACADQGILCIVVKMPSNLAFFGINRAINAINLYPEVENWYIGGHSLGGSIASVCASANPGVFDGVVLLASYSTSNLKSLPVLSIYGNKDDVLNAEKYEKNKKNLPSNFVEYVIDGGNHAYFGMYGKQSGDGQATITNIEQIELTADYIVEFILK